jgi:hypothetical protein
MTAFTGDLDNDLEMLAREHDVTPVVLAKTAIAQMPEHLRHAFIGSMWAALPTPMSEDSPDFAQPHTGLPQKLRGAIHELTRRYPVNLIVDAAMLEMPEDVRVEVATTFLPKKSLREKLGMNTPAPRAELVERETGEVLLSGPADKVFGPGYLRITKDDGSSTLYNVDRTGPEGGVEHEIRADGSRVIRTFYVKVGSA